MVVSSLHIRAGALAFSFAVPVHAPSPGPPRNRPGFRWSSSSKVFWGFFGQQCLPAIGLTTVMLSLIVNAQHLGLLAAVLRVSLY